MSERKVLAFDRHRNSLVLGRNKQRFNDYERFKFGVEGCVRLAEETTRAIWGDLSIERRTTSDRDEIQSAIIRSYLEEKEGFDEVMKMDIGPRDRDASQHEDVKEQLS